MGASQRRCRINRCVAIQADSQGLGVVAQPSFCAPAGAWPPCRWSGRSVAPHIGHASLRPETDRAGRLNARRVGSVASRIYRQQTDGAPMGLRETVERIAAMSRPPANEEAAKIRVLVPILAELGWDVHDHRDTGEVLWEHPVGPGSGAGQKGRADIVLAKTGHGHRLLCLIEAKSPKEDLSKHVDQLMGYAFHEGVDICVLTNGLEWWLYLPREPGPAASRRFAELRLSSSSHQQVADDLEAYMGKANLYGGEAERRAKEALSKLREAERLKTEMPKVWRRMLDEPDQELVDLFARRVHERVRLRPSPEVVTAVLQGKSVDAVPATVPGDPPKGRHPRAQVPRQESPRRGAARTWRRPRAVVLWGNTTEVKSWVGVMVCVAGAVYQRHPHDFLERTKAMAGRKRPFASQDPADLLRAGRISSAEVWVETNLSADDTLKKCKKLLEVFGYSASDLEVLTKE